MAGILNVPGLRGFIAADQLAQQREQGDLARVQGILSLRNMVEQQQLAGQEREMRGLFGEAVASGDMERARGLLARYKPEAFATGLIPKPQEAFTLAPGAIRFDAKGNQIAAAPVADRTQELQMRFEENRRAAQERAELQRQLAQMNIQGRQDLARMTGSITAANRQPQAPVAVQDPNNPGQTVYVTPDKAVGMRPAAGGGKPMSATAQKELIETDEQIQGGQAALDLFRQAKTLNDKAMGFTGAGAVAAAGTLLPEFIRPGAVDATQDLDNILQSAALPQLKAIFGGMPTEGERKILLDVQGSSSKSPKVRKEIFDRAERAIEARIKFSQDKAKALRSGTYFAGDGGVSPAEPRRRASDAGPPPGAVVRIE